MVPRTPLHRPFSTLADPPDWVTNPLVVAVLALGSAMVLAVAVYVLGQVMAAQTTGTVTVDNPAYPGDAFCDNPAFEEVQTEHFPEERCDEPETVQRDPAPMVKETFAEAAAMLFFGWLLLWCFGAVALHVAARFGGGRGSIGDSFAIASWSGAASALAAIPGILLLALAVRSEGYTFSDPERTRQTVEAAIAPVEPYLLLLGLIGTTWQAVVWYAGLVGLHAMDEARAVFVSAFFWLLLVVLGN